MKIAAVEIEEVLILRKIATLFIMLIFLTACGVGSNQYSEYDLIDVKKPVDERELMERAMEEQKEILKPGFIPAYNNIENGFDLSFYSISYNQQTEELTHRVNYTHAISDAFLAFEANKNTGDARYEEKIEAMNDVKPLEQHTGYVGYNEEDGEMRYDFTITEGNVFYFFERGEPETVGFDEEFVQLLGNSLKTEEDGAYSYFYDRFTFKLDELHFPLISQDAVQNMEVKISDLGYWGFDNPNTMLVTYNLEDGGAFDYTINGMDMYADDVSFTVEAEDETKNDISVTIYHDEVAEQNVYAWEKDSYYYSITIDSDQGALATDDIYAIIDSSREDNRSFTNKDVFKNQLEEPIINQTGEKILEQLKAM